MIAFPFALAIQKPAPLGREQFYLPFPVWNYARISSQNTPKDPLFRMLIYLSRYNPIRGFFGGSAPDRLTDRVLLCFG